MPDIARGDYREELAWQEAPRENGRQRLKDLL